MDGHVPTEREIINVDEVRKVLARAGLSVSDKQAVAIAQLVQESGSVHNARLSLETIDALRDAA